MKHIKVLTAFLMVSAPGTTLAETLTWTGNGPDRDFTAAENWIDGSGDPAAPDPGDGVTLGDRLVIGEDARSSSGPVLNSELREGLFEKITVSAPGFTVNTVSFPPVLTIESGRLQALDFNIADGRGQVGRVVQKGGNFQVFDFRTSETTEVTPERGGESEYRLEDGILTASSAVIGDDGTSTFRQEGGTFNAGDLTLGFSNIRLGPDGGELTTRGRADFFLEGGRLNTGLDAPPEESDAGIFGGFFAGGVSTEIGGGAPATFNLSGGTHHVFKGDSTRNALLVVGANNPLGTTDDVVVDDPTKHLGEYLIRGDGHLVVDLDTVVGEGATFTARVDPGNGVMRLRDDGLHEVGRDLILGGYGEFGSGQGRYLVTGGELDVAGDIIIGERGSDGVGTGRMSVTGGNVTARDIRIAPASRSSGEPLASPDNELFIGEGGFGTDTTTFGTVFAEDVIVGGGATAGDNPTAELRVNSGGLLNANSVEARDGGLVTGTGRIDTGRLAMLRRSFLAPGQSPGTLEITGDVLLGDGSTLMLEIAGRNPGDWDILEIGGSLFAEAGAGIQIDFLDGFFPEVGDSFDFFNVAGDATQFDNLLAGGLIGVSIQGGSDLAFDFSSDGIAFSSATVPPSPIPLPASAILLLSSLGGLGAIRLCTRRCQNVS